MTWRSKKNTFTSTTKAKRK